MALDNISIEWIFNYVKEDYNKNHIASAIEALNYFLFLDEGSLQFEATIETMVHASDIDKPQYIRNFSDIERFMKKLLNIIEPGRMDIQPQLINRREWMLEGLYKEGFQIVAPNFRLSTEPKDYYNAPNYLYHYLAIYQYRNKLVHDYQIDLTPVYLQNIIVSTLIVELDLCYRQRNQLKKLYNAKLRHQSFDGIRFCKKIQNDYQAIGYVDIHWTKENQNEHSYTVNEILSEKNTKGIKIVGEAGTGKSTALRRIEFLMAKQYVKKQNGAMPIFIELYSLADGEEIIINRVASIMEISLELCKEFLEYGEIHLLLDGYNEILDTNIKRKVAKELDHLNLNYPKVNIFLSDRAIARSNIPTLVNATKMYLYPLSLEEKKKFFETNTKNMQAKELLFKQMEENPDYFTLIDTPLKLKQLLDVTVHTHEIPMDLTDQFIQFLFEREQNEKKDENIEYLPTFLQALAIDSQDEMSFIMANAKMAKCKEALGFSVPDTMQCLKLAIEMGILVCEQDRNVRFASLEYRDYFYMEAIANQLDEVLGL